MRYQFNIILTALLNILMANVSAQFTNNYWCFGDSAAIDWSNPLNPIVKSSAFFYRNGSSSIADTM
ncbi:MAG: hypothetical protein IPK10_18480 [Bacteroidetes bacterium]|nr:hypothetical protein [Bacteroidota bacterium]